MRIVHLSVSDKENGAHLAGYRLHKGLLRLGVDSTMFVQRRLDDSGDNTIQVYQRPRSLFFRVKTRAYKHWMYRDLRSFPKRMDGRVLISDRAAEGRHVVEQIPAADVIYIHAAYDFVSYEDIALLAQRAHIVFMLHDISYFTGGCTYDPGCGRFTDRCGACPILLSHNENDPTRHVWERKHAVFSRMRNRLHFVAPSQWIARQARRSSLLRNFPIEVVPYGTDTEALHPRSGAAMREYFGIPQDKRVVGFVAQPLDNVFKGFSFLAKALEAMGDTPNLFLLTAGRGKLPVEIRIPHLHLGQIYDTRSLCAFYCSADILAVPSTSDNLPQVVMEAMACGTPVVAFPTGGIPEMARNRVTGLVVPEADPGALRDGIAKQDSAARARMAENARQIAVEEYSMEVQAKRHVDLCARITSSTIAGMRPAYGEGSQKLVGKV